MELTSYKIRQYRIAVLLSKCQFYPRICSEINNNSTIPDNYVTIPCKDSTIRDQCNGIAVWNYHRVKSEPPRGKTNNVVSEQVRHKPACTSTEMS